MNPKRDHSIFRLSASSLVTSTTSIAPGATAIAQALTTQRLSLARRRLPRRRGRGIEAELKRLPSKRPGARRCQRAEP